MASKVILLIEDDADLAEMYSLQLTQAGYQVQVAMDAQTALDLLDQQRVAVILLDMLLPNNNGLAVLHELRSYSDWRQIPVVILSNLASKDIGVSQIQLKQLGVVNYLEKPKTKAEQLVAAVKAALKPSKR